MKTKVNLPNNFTVDETIKCSGGWLVPAYSMPANPEDLVIQRILVRHGVTRDLADLLLEDIRVALHHFDVHPVQVPLSEEEAGGFKH